MHRDIKPPNIYIRDDSSPVLLDFGAARQKSSELTALVTPGYAPFEQYHTDRKSTRLNSSHLVISYAVFCLKKKKYPSFIVRVGTDTHVLFTHVWISVVPCT